MEAIIYIILIVLAIYILVTVVIPAVVAIGGIAAAITAGIAVIVGFFSAVANYFSAIRNNLNFLHWEWKKDDEPARRSYFFGPGYAQLFATIKNAFELNAASGAKISATGSNFKGTSTGTWGVIKGMGYRQNLPAQKQNSFRLPHMSQSFLDPYIHVPRLRCNA